MPTSPTYQPTPTQEENDLAMQGQHVADKEHDGSPITHPGGDPQVAKKKEVVKEVQAEQPPARGGYSTRQVTPKHPPPLRTSSDE